MKKKRFFVFVSQMCKFARSSIDFAKEIDFLCLSDTNGNQRVLSGLCEI